MSDEAAAMLANALVIVALIAGMITCIVTGNGEYAVWFVIVLMWFLFT